MQEKEVHGLWESLSNYSRLMLSVYQLHWPARYSPQSNWGQSLQYRLEVDAGSSYWRGSGGPTSFEDLCVAMEGLIQEGKIRGWGLCNDNAYGLTGCTRTAKMLGTTPPCNLQGDFSLIDRKVRCLHKCFSLLLPFLVT
jgi:aryl-alcohol dehydrogenase-like predicted oxidoreductase